MDKRWNELAKILVNYSVCVQKGEKVLITMMETETWPLARACYQETVLAGGLPFVEFQSAYLERDIMALGSVEQVAWVNDMHLAGMEWADCYIGLRGARSPAELSNIPGEILSAHKHSLGVVSAARNNTRWVLSRVPNESFAQQAGVPLDEMVDFYFASTLLDWSTQLDYLKQIKSLYTAGDTVRIIGFNTDITFSTAGRTYEIADGHCNMPDGELFTSPVEESVNGYIYFDFPGIYAGKVIEGIRLRFENGNIVEYTSDTEQEFLQAVLNMDEGSSRVGEFGIGLNNGITRYCYDILFDEKIGGTIHLALGRGYPNCGGLNSSALHWDIVKDLRREGAIFIDGKKIMENGRYFL